MSPVQASNQARRQTIQSNSIQSSNAAIFSTLVLQMLMLHITKATKATTNDVVVKRAKSIKKCSIHTPQIQINIKEHRPANDERTDVNYWCGRTNTAKQMDECPVFGILEAAAPILWLRSCWWRWAIAYILFLNSTLISKC